MTLGCPCCGSLKTGVHLPGCKHAPKNRSPGRFYATLAILALVLIAVIATPFALFMWLLAKLGGWV